MALVFAVVEIRPEPGRSSQRPHGLHVAAVTSVAEGAQMPALLAGGQHGVVIKGRCGTAGEA